MRGGINRVKQRTNLSCPVRWEGDELGEYQPLFCVVSSQ